MQLQEERIYHSRIKYYAGGGLSLLSYLSRPPRIALSTYSLHEPNLF